MKLRLALLLCLVSFLVSPVWADKASANAVVYSNAFSGVHWAPSLNFRIPRQGSHPPVIIVQTGVRAWPVRQAVREWRRATGVRIYNGRCGEIAHTNCVRVYSRNYGPTGWVGHTDWSVLLWSGGGHEHATITLNRYYSYTWIYRWQTILHELGHALGLTHDMCGVMYPVVDGIHTHIAFLEAALIHRVDAR
jgi:hypothetical protein